MSTLKHAGILGAGLGSRLQGVATCKPLAMLGNESLLTRLITLLRHEGVENIHCALRDELVEQSLRASLPGGCHYLFVNTESSLHTLAEVAASFTPPPEHLFLTMADTVLHKEDFEGYFRFCQSLKTDECAILATHHIDDEKPLYVTLGTNGLITEFGSNPTNLVTSGMYCLSRSALGHIAGQVDSGMNKMRNFLSFLTAQKVPIKAYIVEKTVDVDHPRDLKQALEFLES